MTGPVYDQLALAIDAEIQELLDAHAGSDEPFDWFGYADSTERGLARDPSAATFDPDDPEVWRGVIVELRRRGMRQGIG